MPLTPEQLERVRLNQEEFQRNKDIEDKERNDARNARRRDKYRKDKIKKQFDEEYPDGIDGLWVGVLKQDRHVPPQKKAKTLSNDSGEREANGAEGADEGWVNARVFSGGKPKSLMSKMKRQNAKAWPLRK